MVQAPFFSEHGGWSWLKRYGNVFRSECLPIHLCYLSDMFSTEPSIFSSCLAKVLPPVLLAMLHHCVVGAGVQGVQTVNPKQCKKIPRNQHQWIRIFGFRHNEIECIPNSQVSQQVRPELARHTIPTNIHPENHPCQRNIVFQPPTRGKVQVSWKYTGFIR